MANSTTPRTCRSVAACTTSTPARPCRRTRTAGVGRTRCGARPGADSSACTHRRSVARAHLDRPRLPAHPAHPPRHLAVTNEAQVRGAVGADPGRDRSHLTATPARLHRAPRPIRARSTELRCAAVAGASQPCGATALFALPERARVSIAALADHPRPVLGVPALGRSQLTAASAHVPAARIALPARLAHARIAVPRPRA